MKIHCENCGAEVPISAKQAAAIMGAKGGRAAGSVKAHDPKPRNEGYKSWYWGLSDKARERYLRRRTLARKPQE